MDNSKNVQSEHLGVNKIGKRLRKSQLHQPNFSNNAAGQQPQPQVYNISKNDFRNIVQKLTGSPSQEPLPRPPHSQKPQSMRLQRIRPPPLSPINRHQTPPPVANNSFVRPFGPYAGGSHLSAPQFPPLTSGHVFWTNSSQSPISAYMRYFQTDPSPRGNSPLQAPIQSQIVAQLSAGNPTNPLPPNMPSPTSQFLLPSPSFYSNSLSSLLSPGIGFSQIISRNFSFSPLAHPPSPSLFPLSPSGFFSFSSPKWREQ